jgi:hypothetical protein
MHRRRVGTLFAAGLLIIGTLVTAVPATAKGHLDVLMEELSSPKGLFAGGQSLFVGQGWIGPPGPVFEYALTGRNRGLATAISDPIATGDIAGTPDGAGWAIVYPDATSVAVVRQASLGGDVEPILDVGDYQASDPDPDDQENNPTETNPNGLTGLWNNDVLLADAAANDLLRISPNGDAVTVARWPRRAIPNHIPGLPATMMAEAVPTTVTIGPDGWAYVGQLVGFPGTPGTANIWRVDPLGEDEVCSVDPAVATDGCSVWKSGFTSIFDIAFNNRNGTLYVYEVAEGGWLAFEEGFATGDFPPAVLLEVKGGKTRELVPGQLSEPGGVSVGFDGNVYVTDGSITLGEPHGRLLRIRGN